MKYSDNKHLCHLTVASCKPLIINIAQKRSWKQVN
ncbi:hypothetical protein IMSAGC006_02127 [Muribaculaceae bacterium]|nr:hypothetical protein IMSAGC006_02127 [Muribaculaceae bacterium]